MIIRHLDPWGTWSLWEGQFSDLWRFDAAGRPGSRWEKIEVMWMKLRVQGV